MEQGVDSPEKPVRVAAGEPADSEVSESHTAGDEAATAAPAGEAGGGSDTAPPAAVLSATAQDTEAAEEAGAAADTPPAGTDAAPDPEDAAADGGPRSASASASPEAADAVASREDAAQDGDPRPADAVAPPMETGAAADPGDSDQDRKSDTEDAAAADGKVAQALVAAAVDTATSPAEPSAAPGGRPRRRVLIGEVLSDKAEQSIVVSIAHRKKHRLYKKYRTLTKKLMAHDPDNSCRVGDLVRVIETRPLSRMKRWRVVEVVKRAT